MEYQDIIENLYTSIHNFIYKYGVQPNAIFINYSVLHTLLCMEKFREIGTTEGHRFKILGLNVYGTLDQDIFIKVAFID